MLLINCRRILSIQLARRNFERYPHAEEITGPTLKVPWKNILRLSTLHYKQHITAGVTLTYRDAGWCRHVNKTTGCWCNWPYGALSKNTLFNCTRSYDISSPYPVISYIWWFYRMETFSSLLALCAGNSPETGEFPAERPVTRSFNVFFDLRNIFVHV